jgi:hypothetical protein
LTAERRAGEGMLWTEEEGKGLVDGRVLEEEPDDDDDEVQERAVAMVMVAVEEEEEEEEEGEEEDVSGLEVGRVFTKRFCLVIAWNADLKTLLHSPLDAAETLAAAGQRHLQTSEQMRQSNDDNDEQMMTTMSK